MKHPAKQLYDYHTWANARFFDHLKSLPDEVFHTEIKSVFSSVREVFIHIYQVDGLWLSVMSGDSFSETMKTIKELQTKSTDKGLAEMQELYAELSGLYDAFLDELDDPDTIISIEHPEFGELEASIADLIKHVVNHGTYHRGNITAMLRQQGQEGVPTDYIFYLHNISES